MGSGRWDVFTSLEDELEGLAASALRRTPSVHTAEPVNSFCSNDYLGFGAETVVASFRGGASASPIVSGHLDVHEQAARAFAAWLDTETITLFSSTYAANLGVLQAIGGPRTMVISDALNHASIIDGCRLSRADVHVVPHLDLAAVAAILEREARTYERVWVVTEAYFSMDADSPDLPRLRELCDTYGAGLVVDEAHSLGVFGAEGRGRSHAAGVTPDILVGALGKAVGLHGGFVGGRRIVRDLLWNKARSLVFSTGISPLIASVVPERVESVRRADDRRGRLVEVATRLRSQLGPAARGHGPIIPWIVGDSRRALTLADELSRTGFVVRAIRPPTVPEGTARLRIAVSSVHTDALADALAKQLCRFT